MSLLSIPVSPGDAEALEAAAKVYAQMKPELLSPAEVEQHVALFRSVISRFRFGSKLSGNEIGPFVALVDFAYSVVHGKLILPDKLKKQLRPYRQNYDRLYPYVFPFLLLDGEAELPP